MSRGGRRIGAGRPGRRNKVEDCPRLDVRHLFGGVADSENATATSRALWRHAAQIVAITRTACRFGGYRQWFVCPSCKGRAGLLYFAGDSLACRSCHGLAYRSQSSGAMAKAFARMFRHANKLGPDFTRPTGMHAQTYLDTLIRAHDAFAFASSIVDRHMTNVSSELERLGLLEAGAKG